MTSKPVNPATNTSLPRKDLESKGVDNHDLFPVHIETRKNSTESTRSARGNMSPTPRCAFGEWHLPKTAVERLEHHSATNADDLWQSACRSAEVRRGQHITRQGINSRGRYPQSHRKECRRSVKQTSSQEGYTVSRVNVTIAVKPDVRQAAQRTHPSCPRKRTQEKQRLEQEGNGFKKKEGVQVIFVRTSTSDSEKCRVCSRATWKSLCAEPQCRSRTSRKDKIGQRSGRHTATEVEAAATVASSITMVSRGWYHRVTTRVIEPPVRMSPNSSNAIEHVFDSHTEEKVNTAVAWSTDKVCSKHRKKQGQVLFHEPVRKFRFRRPGRIRSGHCIRPKSRPEQNPQGEGDREHLKRKDREPKSIKHRKTSATSRLHVRYIQSEAAAKQATP